MKKLSLMIAISAMSTMLMAGGNIAPVSKEAKIAPIACDNDKVYVQVQESQDLVWQDMKYTDQEVGAYKKNKTAGKAGNAFYAKKYCRTLDYAGSSDWRLPTSEELMSVYNPIEQVTFENKISDNYWSSTPEAQGKSYAVFAADGYRYAKKTGKTYYIRCVRCVDKVAEVK